ncbi:ESX secretion-associated protein EspG [Saccharothrix deserti]|uniref:ESX secretion-associated protein EspG n=1 Tax=Saccharothrix deserti TaxID=2593674 RepID=UPI00131B21FB|nr:ESX secretion-associated protein EspG [Saccharothrix deserti]
MADDHIALTLRTTLTLLRRRGVEPHPVFASTLSWHSEEALRKLDVEADEELRRLHLLDGRRLHRGLGSALRALDRSSREYYGWIDTTIGGSPRSFAVLAAQAGPSGTGVGDNAEICSRSSPACRRPGLPGSPPALRGRRPR